MVSARGLRILGFGLIAGGAAWALFWSLWLAAQHHAGQLDVAAALLGFLLFALLPTLAAWIGGGIVLARSRRRAQEEGEADLESRVAEAVRTRGIVRLGELAREWQLPEPAVRAAVERLVGLNLFHGQVDWKRGELTAEYVDLTQVCPHCGGPLEPAGQGLLVCRYCGSRFPEKPDDADAHEEPAE